MGNSSSDTDDQLPDGYLNSLGMNVDTKQNSVVSEEDRQRFINCIVVSALAYKDDPYDYLLSITGVKHDIRMVKLAKSIDMIKTNQQYVIASNSNESEYYVGLRGSTSDLSDWQRNLSLFPIPVIGGNIHAGFRKCALEVNMNIVIDLINKGKKVIITGHSKGGAAAQAYVITLLTNPLIVNTDLVLNNVQCISIASPFVVDRELSAYIKKHGWGKIFHNIVNKGDIVPLAFTIYYENFLSNQSLFESNDFKKFQEYLSSLNELALTYLLKLVNVPLPAAAAISKLIIKGFKTALKWMKHQLRDKAYYPFGYIYQLSSGFDINSHIKHINNNNDVIDVFKPPTIRNINERYITTHFLNSYLIEIIVRSEINNNVNNIVLNNNNLQSKFLDIHDIEVIKRNRSIAEVDILVKGINARLVQAVTIQSSNIYLIHKVIDNEEDRNYQYIQIKASYRIISKSISNLNILIISIIGLFNDVNIDVTLPELPKELTNHPASQFANKSMIEVVKIAMTRCLLLGSMLSSGDNLISASMRSNITNALSNLDELAKLTSWVHFIDMILNYNFDWQRDIQSSSYDPVKKKRLVLEKANLLVDVIESSYSFGILYGDLTLNYKQYLFMKALFEVTDRDYSDKLPNFSDVVSDSGGSVISYYYDYNTYHPNSPILPSNLYNRLLSSNGSMGILNEVFQSAEITISTVESLLLKQYSDSEIFEDSTLGMKILSSVYFITFSSIYFGIMLAVFPIVAIPLAIGSIYLTNETISWENIFSVNPQAIHNIFVEIYLKNQFNYLKTIYSKNMLRNLYLSNNMLSFLIKYINHGYDLGFEESKDSLSMEYYLCQRFISLTGSKPVQSLDEFRNVLSNNASANSFLARFNRLNRNYKVDKLVYNLIKAVTIVHQIRCDLGSSFYIAVTGNARLGKSHLIHDLFHANTNYGSGIENRTSKITSYVCKKINNNITETIDGMFVIDFPGSNDETAINPELIFRDGMSAVDVMLILLDGQNPHLTSAIDLIKTIVDLNVDIPVLICFNKTDNWANELNHNITSDEFKEQVKLTKQDFLQLCVDKGIHIENLDKLEIQPTCFNLKIPAVNRCLIDSGVWDASDVHNWLKSNSNIPINWRSTLSEQFELINDSNCNRNWKHSIN